MKLFFRALLKSVWLFLAWLLIRVWEQRFEVSPLPVWTLTAFVYLVLLLVAFLLAYRLFRHEEVHTHAVTVGMGTMLIGALGWEMGLLVWLPGGSWSAVSTLLTWGTMGALLAEMIGIAVAASYLHHRQAVQAALLAEDLPVEEHIDHLA